MIIVLGMLAFIAIIIVCALLATIMHERGECPYCKGVKNDGD